MAEQQDIRWIQRLSNYNKAVARLQDAVAITSANNGFGKETDDLLKEGLIQRFEYTQELAWKVMKDYEEYQGYTDIQGSRDAIRKALQMGIINSPAWMNTIYSRNLTSHCYDEKEFNTILQQITVDYLPIFVSFSEKMNSIKTAII
jgi:nucleotidyltransferase substrate binding protein (TIGR01987 family)